MQVTKVMVPVVGHASDAEAMELGCSLVRAHKGKVYVLYVIEVRRSEPVDADIPQETVERGEAILRNLEELAREQKCEVEGDVVQARSAGPAVVEEAVKRGVDAIIMAMPYKHRFGSFSLGDTVPYILRYAPCRVMVLREPTPARVGASSW